MAEQLNLEAERAAFNVWFEGWHDPLIGRVENQVQRHAAWAAWQESCRASAPAPEGDALPPLPTPDEHFMTSKHVYTAEQVEQIRRDAILAEDEKKAELRARLTEAYGQIAALRAALSRQSSAAPKMLGHELSGVIIDVESGHGFDGICLETIKRVRDALLSGDTSSVAAPSLADAPQADRQVNDLAMLTRRLLHALNFKDPGNAVAKKAADYLKREGLQGDPVRAEDVLRAETEEEN